MNDHATLARIEDHLRRQAEAAERIADVLEARPQVHAVSRDPSRCEPGCVRASLHGGDCDVYPETIREAIEREQERRAAAKPCAVAMPGHHCKRLAHPADELHIWVVTAVEQDRIEAMAIAAENGATD